MVESILFIVLAFILLCDICLVNNLVVFDIFKFNVLLVMFFIIIGVFFDVDWKVILLFMIFVFNIVVC